MNKKIATNLILALSLVTTAQLTNSAAFSHESVASQSSLVKPEAKNSLIARAVDKNLSSNTDNLQMMNSLKATPSQNFFAIQNQKFTRFIQSLFG